MANVDSTKVSLKCPSCKRALDSTVAQIVNYRKVECSSCKSAFVFGSSELSELRSSCSEVDNTKRNLEEAQKRATAATTRFDKALKQSIDKATLEIKKK